VSYACNLTKYRPIVENFEPQDLAVNLQKINH